MNQKDNKRTQAIKTHKAMATDLLVVPGIARQPVKRSGTSRPGKKRRIDYVRKIANDPFIFMV